MDKSKLISFDEYRKERHVVPYTFVHKSGDRVIYFFGSRHSFDPADPEFPLLERFWNEFLQATEGKKRIVFEEGGIRPFVEDKSLAIIKYSEMGYLTYLATKAKIEIFSPEPSENLRFSELAKHFDKEWVAYYDFAQMAYQWNKMLPDNRPNFETYMQFSLDASARDSGWEGFDFSIDHMKHIHKELFAAELDQNNARFFYDIINPATPEKSIINKISRFEDDEFREMHILKQFERYWNESYSIFAVYGSGHAYRQEPALKTLESF